MKLSTLRTFIVVARHGNITAAAEELRRTPAAISLALKQLEASLGQPLFLGERKSQLTPLGEFVLEQAGRQVQQFDETLRNIERFARNEVGHLAVASVPSFATRVLPDVIREFHQRWPNVQVELHEMDSIAVSDALRRQEVEVGFISAQEKISDGVLLLQDDFGVVCHYRHPLTKISAPIGWDDLASSRFIANRLCTIIADPAFHAILDRANLRVHNTGSLLALTANDVGVTVLPRLAVPDGARSVVFLPLETGHYARYIHMFTLSRQTSSPMVMAWCVLVREAVSRMPNAVSNG